MWTTIKTSAVAGIIGFTALTAQIAPASAADIYDKYGPRTSSPYDDPRYADIYSHPKPQPPPYAYAEPRYVDPPRYVEPPPVHAPRYERPYAYNHGPQPLPRDRHGYLEPVNPHAPRHYAQPDQCVHQGEIRRSLINEGWRDFQDLEFRGEVAVVRARRPNGQLYSLKVNRCSGDIVHARPLEDRPVPYAYRERYEGRTY
jgi:hypothetical protein